MAAGGLEDGIQGLGTLLESRVEELMDEIAVRLRDEVPALGALEQPEMWDPWRASTRANLLGAFGALRRWRRAPAVLPPESEEVARLTARRGGDLSTLLQTYRVGHAVTWELWLDEVEAWAADTEIKRALRAVGSRFMFRYVDELMNFVIQVFTDERDRSVRRREQQRVQLVRDLLDGVDVDSGALGYDVTGRHVGVIAFGDSAHASAQSLAAALGRQLLAVSVTGSTVWAWLGGGSLGTAALERALSRFRPPRGTTVAVGDPAAGPDGFRLTHQQARLAQSVALTNRELALVRYADVALEALALRDEVLAHQFVERELAGIDGDDVRSQRLRETLAAYFAAGGNAAGAAALLGVHERTVANRLRSIEQRIGASPATRRAELETALRLRAVFGGASSTRSPVLSGSGARRRSGASAPSARG